MSIRPFAPKAGGTIAITNATSATADQALEPDCETLALYNSSATAISFVRITPYDTNALGTAVAPTVTTDMPVPPAQRVLIRVPYGFKEIRTIASAADGILYVTQGNGGV
jgi:hypothetical protein